MQQIELARQYFQQYGLPMLQREFPELLPELACGIAGHGSECFGFDDDLSHDHDFAAGFAVYLPEELEKEHGFALERAYRKLLKEHPFPGAPSQSSRLGEAECGIIAIEEFFRRHIGVPGVPEDWQVWLHTPEYAFAEALNGTVFYDGPGRFTALRKAIAGGMPEDVRLKKLAARAAVMAQSGQYNFARCLKHGERGAAFLALAEFVRSTVSMIFLLNRAFCPYYKWAFRALRRLKTLSQLADALEFLLTEAAPDEVKQELIEDTASQIIAELHRQNLSSAGDSYLEAHAFAIMQKIMDRKIRSLHVMEG